MKTHLTLIIVLLLALMPAPTLRGGSSLSTVRGDSRKIVTASPTEPTPPREENVNQASLTAAYSKLPLSFEINHGQTDAQVKFLARGDGYRLFLTSSEVVLSLSKPVITSEAKDLTLTANQGPG